MADDANAVVAGGVVVAAVVVSVDAVDVVKATIVDWLDKWTVEAEARVVRAPSVAKIDPLR